jgi:hypothetical protein
MKPPRRRQDQFSRNVPELIQQLRGLYSGMEQDPTLSESAAHIRRAVASLENACQQAWEVYEECEGTRSDGTLRRPAGAAPATGGDAAEWLRNLQPASPLKQ